MFVKAFFLSLKIYLIYLVIIVPAASLLEIIRWADRTRDFGMMVLRAISGSIYYFGLYGLVALPLVFAGIFIYLQVRKNDGS